MITKRGFAPIVILLFVAVVGVIALVWFSQSKTNTAEQLTQQVSTTTDEVLDSLQIIGVSDEVSDIEEDLSNTDLENLDKEMLEVDSNTLQL